MIPSIFGKTKLVTSYFQQMTFRSKISKIIDTQLQNNSHFTSFLERIVNYFENFEAECYLLKIGYTESSFTKQRINVIYPNIIF